jgi:NADP-dependent 3-hydroxy acid dehydrogenase YdfG
MSPAGELSGTTALVTGASRGFGRGIAVALSAAGANVLGVARHGDRLAELRAELGDSFTPVAADAARWWPARSITDLVTGSYELDACLLTAAGLAPVP